MRKIQNKGQQPQYYVLNSHDAIISEETFEKAQALAKMRRSTPSNQPIPNALSKCLCCGNCGSVCRRRMIRAKQYWVCRVHFEDSTQCSGPQIAETQIHAAFLRLYHKLKRHGGSILTEMLNDLQTIRRSRMLWSQDVVELNKRISELTSQNQMLAELKQQGLVDPDFFISQTSQLAEQLRAAKLEKQRHMDAEGDDTIARTKELIEVLDAAPDFLPKFDGELFVELVDRIIVENHTRLRFRLKNGLEVREPLERT
jgi:hypothetical protein